MTIKEFRAYCAEHHPDKGLLVGFKDLCKIFGQSREVMEVARHELCFPYERLARRKLYNREDIFYLIQGTRYRQ